MFRTKAALVDSDSKEFKDGVDSVTIGIVLKEKFKVKSENLLLKTHEKICLPLIDGSSNKLVAIFTK